MTAPALPLLHVRRIYADMTANVDAARVARKFPCAEGCAGCCHLPIHCYDRDLDLIREAIADLPDAEREAIYGRAVAYRERIKGLRFSEEGYERLRAKGRGLLLTAFAVAWPKGGIACPLLAPEAAPEPEPEATQQNAPDGQQNAPAPAILRGACAVYGARPADCRMHVARGPGACVPPRCGTEILEVGWARQQLERVLRLKTAGLLGLEVWRMLRVALN